MKRFRLIKDSPYSKGLEVGKTYWGDRSGDLGLYVESLAKDYKNHWQEVFTIEDLSNGKCSVINDGSLDELQRVLGAAFPKYTWQVYGAFKYYFMKKSDSNKWDCWDENEGTAQSVKTFIEELEDVRVVTEGDTINIELPSCSTYHVKAVKGDKIKIELPNGSTINIVA